MARPPGRDPLDAMKRLARILTVLAQDHPDWSDRDRVIELCEYGGKDLNNRRSMFDRDCRTLAGMGHTIEHNGRHGKQARIRLGSLDPRLATSLSAAAVTQLARAIEAADDDPAAFGLPPSDSPPNTVVPVRWGQVDAVRLESVLHALRHRCVLHATYRDKERQLEVDEVYRTGTGRWRVIARDLSDGGLQKQFRLERFTSIALDLPDTAGPRRPDATTKDPLAIVSGDPVTAIIETPYEYQDQVIAELGEPETTKRLGATVVMHIPVTNRRLWRLRLYELGTRVRLLGPADLQTEVRDELLSFVTTPESVHG